MHANAFWRQIAVQLSRRNASLCLSSAFRLLAGKPERSVSDCRDFYVSLECANYVGASCFGRAGWPASRPSRYACNLSVLRKSFFRQLQRLQDNTVLVVRCAEGGNKATIRCAAAFVSIWLFPGKRFGIEVVYHSSLLRKLLYILIQIFYSTPQLLFGSAPII
jgi:hypothetical protein